MDINGMNQMYESLGISREVREFAAETEKALRERFEAIDAVAEYNQMKVIKGMQDNRVSDIHFAATTGYGYNDLGRDTRWRMCMPAYSTVKRPYASSALARRRTYPSCGLSGSVTVQGTSFCRLWASPMTPWRKS